MKNYFDQQNEKFYDFLDDTFCLRKMKTWDDLAKSITFEKVVYTYRVFSVLFPNDYDYIDELRKMNTDFSSIHYGSIKGNRIIDDVVRFSLYSDCIFVFHPLQNPSITAKHIDPRNNPNLWMLDFLDALYFYIVIRQWVKAGIVKLILNPWEYDRELHNKIVDNFRNEDIDAFIDKHSNLDTLMKNPDNPVAISVAETFAIDCPHRDKLSIIGYLRSLKSELVVESSIADLADRIIDAFPRLNPLYDKLDRRLLTRTGFTTTRGGGPIESLKFISEITGGSIFTPHELNWIRLQEYGINDFWTKTNHLYSKIPLNFLNNVDTAFALEIRKEDRLAGVRQELRKVYKELETIDINNLNMQNIRVIQEGFLEEVRRADADWNYISKKAEIWRKEWFLKSVSAIGGSVAACNVSFLPLISTSVLSLGYLAANITKVSSEQDRFRIKNPMSVYVDLKNDTRSHFFTELKNCVF